MRADQTAFLSNIIRLLWRKRVLKSGLPHTVNHGKPGTLQDSKNIGVAAVICKGLSICARARNIRFDFNFFPVFPPQVTRLPYS